MLRSRITKKYRDNRNYWLLALMLILLSIGPGLVELTGFSKELFTILFSTTIMSGILVATHSKWALRLGMFLGVLSIACVWVNYGMIEYSVSRSTMFTIIFLAFFLFIGYHILQELLDDSVIDINTIFAAISGYLLIGIIGGVLFNYLFVLDTQSLKIEKASTGFEFYYFSMVTLTTLGYGDITPRNAPAQSLSILLAIVGQLYLTILVAILVGRYMVENNNKKKE